MLKKETIERMQEAWQGLYSKNTLRRCTKCLLTETVPHIAFDANGVCNYCNGYTRTSVKGEELLEKTVAPLRNGNKKNDCIVSLSGGRDSSYGLHYVKKILGLNPIAYTYDWGMATDIARRNQERMCQALGVERVIIRADYAKKRRNIKRNIEAWLKKPDLGLIPLLMAGDKQVMFYARQLKKKLKIKLMFHCLGNSFEDSLFKTGFSNVALRSPVIYCDIPNSSKFKLALYYAQRFIENPAFINTSLGNTFWGYLSVFFIKRDPYDIFLYHFLKWDEERILRTLKGEYGWESPQETCLTWRIDDATSAFYNYVYMTIAGFTENDTFRSCQVREGVFSREEALKLVEKENRPRSEALEWYGRTVGFDVDRAVGIINAVPKLYRT